MSATEATTTTKTGTQVWQEVKPLLKIRIGERAFVHRFNSLRVEVYDPMASKLIVSVATIDQKKAIKRVYLHDFISCWFEVTRLSVEVQIIARLEKNRRTGINDPEAEPRHKEIDYVQEEKVRPMISASATKKKPLANRIEVYASRAYQHTRCINFEFWARFMANTYEVSYAEVMTNRRQAQKLVLIRNLSIYLALISMSSTFEQIRGVLTAISKRSIHKAFNDVANMLKKDVVLSKRVENYKEVINNLTLEAVAE